eukprot:4812789-Alexandrium_andersonii.AAC.1
MALSAREERVRAAGMETGNHPEVRKVRELEERLLDRSRASLTAIRGDVVDDPGGGGHSQACVT